MVGFLLAVTFGCGLFVAGAHVINRDFIAPAYDVAANLTAFGCAVAASLLLHHWFSAFFAALAVGCWLLLAWRTARALRRREPALGQATLKADAADPSADCTPQPT